MDSVCYDGISVVNKQRINMDGVLLKRHQIGSEAVFASGKKKGLKTASTYSALLLCGSRYYIVHAGDSRVYRRMHGESRCN